MTISLDRGLLCVGSHLPASAESGSRTPEWLLVLYTSTQYTDRTPSAQSSILGSTLSFAATVRRHCGVSRRRGPRRGLRSVRPAPRASCTASRVSYHLSFTTLPPHSTQYKCTIATRTMQSAQPKTPPPLRSVERGLPLSSLVTHRAATLSHARRHPHTAALTHRPHTRCPRTRCPYASP